MSTILITGANRGLGLELVRQYAADGDRVLACCRQPDAADDLQALAAAHERLDIHLLDVADFEAVDRLATELRGTAIDCLINNAGVFGPDPQFGSGQGQSFGQMDYAAWAEVLRINTLAPFKMAEAFVEHLAAGGESKIVSITSSMGSIADTGSGYYAYRSSKAALNMAMRSLAMNLRSRGIVVAVLCPGWVRTDMGGAGAPLEPVESVTAMRRVIAGLQPRDSGRFLRHTGREAPW